MNSATSMRSSSVLNAFSNTAASGNAAPSALFAAALMATAASSPFPFLTAASDPADTAAMLKEMATAGVAMALLVTLVWLGIVGVTALIEKRAEKEADGIENADSPTEASR